MTITKEQIQEILNSDEGKALFQEAFKAEVQAKGYRTPEEIDGLNNKNRELLGKLKELKEQKNSNPLLTKLEKYAIYSEEDLEGVLSASSTSKGKADETERTLKKYERELEILRKEKADYETLAQKTKERYFQSEKQKAILSSLANAGIDESAHDILSVYFDRLTQVEEDGDKLSMIADDGAQRIPLGDYIKKWSTTDKAKHYIKAPSNSGAGTSGTGGVKPSGKMSLDQIEAIQDSKARAQAMIENGYL